MSENANDLANDLAKDFKAFYELGVEDATDELARLQAENERLRDALEDIADGTHGIPPQNYQEAARFWQSRHDLFAGIAQECLAEVRKALEGGE